MPTDLPPPVAITALPAPEMAERTPAYGPADPRPQKEPARQPCEQGSVDEIVVCAPDPEADRLNDLPAMEQALLPKAEIDIGKNAKSVLRAAPNGMTGGVGVMVDFKIRF